MSTICTSTLLGRLIDLDVFDDQVARIEALGVRVGFGVLEKVEEVLGGFLGPAGFGYAELFACEPPKEKLAWPAHGHICCHNCCQRDEIVGGGDEP